MKCLRTDPRIFLDASVGEPTTHPVRIGLKYPHSAVLVPVLRNGLSLVRSVAGVPPRTLHCCKESWLTKDSLRSLSCTMQGSRRLKDELFLLRPCGLRRTQRVRLAPGPFGVENSEVRSQATHARSFSETVRTSVRNGSRRDRITNRVQSVLTAEDLWLRAEGSELTL